MSSKRWWVAALAVLVGAGAAVAWRQHELPQQKRLTAAPMPRALAGPPSTGPVAIPPITAQEPVPAALLKQDLPLSAIVSQLLASEQPQDAYAAYWLVTACTAHNGRHGPPLPKDRPPLPPDERRRMDRMCGSMTERERQARLDYLAAAVKGGVPGAAWRYMVEGPFGDPSALKTRPDDPLVVEWKAEASAQIERAAERGDLQVLIIWGLQKLHGSELATRDPQLGYAYLLAFGLLAAQQNGANDMTARIYREGSEQMDAFGTGLSQQQRAAALALARRIADQVARAR